MAGLYNEILVGRFNRGLQKLLDLKAEAPAPQLAPEIAYQLVQLIDAREQALFGDYRYLSGATQAAVAAQFSRFRFRNPANSGVIAVIQQIVGATAVASDLLVTLETQGGVGDLATSISRSGFDRRGKITPTCVLSRTTAALGGLEQGVFPTGAGPFTVLSADAGSSWPVLPGSSILFELSVANAALVLTLTWRERPVEESEMRESPG